MHAFIRNLKPISNMNKIFITAILAIAATGIYVTQTVNAIDEDQSWICKQQNHFGTSNSELLTCTLMQDSELFTQKSDSKLYNQLKNGIETFDILKTTTINEGELEN